MRTATRDPLIDGHGRPIGDVRISVTDRCNFRCTYCMPAEGLPWLQRDGLLTYEEIARLVRILSEMGVHDVRLTGGEPLVRKELWRLVGAISAIPGVQDLSLTTNGYLLEAQVADLVAAGLRRVNVSLDALASDRFFQLTRRDALGRVLDGLKAAQAHPELRPIKVNAVREWDMAKVLPSAENKAIIETEYELVPLGRERHGTARRYRFADGKGEIGFISPVTEPFCGDCNRIRLTAEGMLRTCLFSMNETDLRAPLRNGASDAELEEIVRDAVWRKELKHHVGEPGFIQPARSMSRIGG